MFEGAYYLSLREEDRHEVQARLHRDVGFADKVQIVAMNVDKFARDDDYEQFCRFMLSVGEYSSMNGKELSMNYVHQVVLVPNIAREMRPKVGDFYKRFYHFDGLVGLMNLAENSLRILGLKPIDDQIMTVALASWEKAVQRLVYLVKYQKAPCR